MLLRSVRFARLLPILPLLAALLSAIGAASYAQTSVNLRVMAANLNGASQTIEPYAIRTFQGLKPDVVCIQEFNYGKNTAAELRSFVDTAFGMGFYYYREEGSYSIPNGVISRYPIIASGTWDDTLVADRGFAWARIDLPGTNDLYVVSVHFLTSGSSVRGTQAGNLKSLIQSSFPSGAWIIVAGDFNADTRTEACVTTFNGLLSDNPIPTDAESGGNFNTNNGRNKPYDYVLVSQTMTNRMTNTVIGTRSFPKGLVFDSRVYVPLSDVSPVQSGDSSTAQHMAVVKDFNIPTFTVLSSIPVISQQPQSVSVSAGMQASFSVIVSGAEPMSYQWRSNAVPVPGATASSFTLANVQPSFAAGYSVVVTNSYGAVTSSVASLTIAVAGEQVVLAGWDTAGLGDYGPSPMAATTNAVGLVVGGLTRGAGIKTLNTAAINSWGGNDTATASLQAAIDAGDYATFSIAGTGSRRVSFTEVSTFNYKRSPSGATSGVLQYQLGNSDFFNIATNSFSSTIAVSLAPISLSHIAALQNVGPGTNVTFRLVLFGASSTGGNWYITDVSGSPAPDIAISGTVSFPSAPSLSQPQTAAGKITFSVQGSTGALYVLESATNLAGNWLPVATNQAPFTNSVSADHPHQFFRARSF